MKPSLSSKLWYAAGWGTFFLIFPISLFIIGKVSDTQESIISFVVLLLGGICFYESKKDPSLRKKIEFALFHIFGFVLFVIIAGSIALKYAFYSEGFQL